MVLYIASCLAVEIIAKDTWLRGHPDTREIIASNFNSLDNVFLTYVQFVTVDDLASIYVPLVRQRWYLFFYFGMLIVLVPVAILNLVTATLVDKSIAQSQEDAEVERQRMRRLLPHIKEAFKTADADGDHILSRAEVENCIDCLPRVLKEIVKKRGLDELFDILDADGQGEVTEEEFTEAVFHLTQKNVDLEVLQDKRLMRGLKQKSEHILQALTGINTVVCQSAQLPCTSRDSKQPGHAWSL